MTANDLKTILDSKLKSGVFQFTPEQAQEITASKNQFEQGLIIENDELEQEVQKWLAAR